MDRKFSTGMLVTGIACLIICALVIFADEKPKDAPPVAASSVEAANPAPKPITVSVTPALLAAYEAAQKKTADAKAALEGSAVYKEYQLAFSQEQSSLLYIMGESGAKPSECTPAVDKQGKLTHLECQPPPKDTKAKP